MQRSTNVAEEENKQELYNQPQATLDKKTPRDILILMSDMSAKVWKDNAGREFITGKEGICNINGVGQLFADLCSHNDMVIGGTTFPFPHKDIHKTTWEYPEKKSRNLIDLITGR